MQWIVCKLCGVPPPQSLLVTIHNEGVVEQEKKNSKKRKRNVDAVKALTELVEKSDQQEIQDAKNADGDFPYQPLQDSLQAP